MRKKVGGLLIAMVVLHAGVSRAMTSASCRDDGVQGEEIWQGVKQAVTDPATGLVVRLEQDVPGHLMVDVTDETVSIHKDLRGSTSTTTLTDGRHHLSLSFDGRDLVVRGLKDELRGSIANPESLVPVFRRLKDSALVQSAKGVLDRMALQADRPEGNALLLTRALLGSVAGEISSVEQYQRWTRHTLTQPRVIRVGQSRGPGQCWDEYAREALRIFDEYGDCVVSCRWYQPFCEEGCEAIYTLRAEMAFMWYFNCNGPFYAG
jgi:hypothetical protein